MVCKARSVFRYAGHTHTHTHTHTLTHTHSHSHTHTHTYTAGQLSVTLLNGHFPDVTYIGLSYTPDPYVILSIGGESWTSSTQNGNGVTFNQGHTFTNDYAFNVNTL